MKRRWWWWKVLGFFFLKKVFFWKVFFFWKQFFSEKSFFLKKVFFENFFLKKVFFLKKKLSNRLLERKLSTTSPSSVSPAFSAQSAPHERGRQSPRRSSPWTSPRGAWSPPKHLHTRGNIPHQKWNKDIKQKIQLNSAVLSSNNTSAKPMSPRARVLHINQSINQSIEQTEGSKSFNQPINPWLTIDCFW